MADLESKDEEVKVVASSKALLASDKLSALEYKGRAQLNLVAEEVKSTEQALKQLKQSIPVHEFRYRRFEQEVEVSPPEQTVADSPRIHTRSEKAPVEVQTNLEFHDRPRTYLSLEAQCKISKICSARGPPVPIDENPGDVLDELIDDLRSARWSRERVEPKVVPNPDLFCLSSEQRRRIAPDVSNIYDQVGFTFSLPRPM